MRKRNKFKNENQYQLKFQAESDSFLQKKLSSLTQFAPANKAKSSKTAQSMETDKTGSGEAVQSSGISKNETEATTQSKSLSKKSIEGKVKRITCGSKAVGLLFDNLITVEELAVIFGLAPQTIRNWVAQGKLPYVKLGKRNMFLKGSLQKWLNQKEEPQWQ